MPSSLTPFYAWSKERILTGPWMVMPVALFVLGHGPDAYQVSMIPALYAATVFFRAFDDFFCFAYDQSHRTSDYQQYGKRPLLILALPSGLIYLCTLPYLFTIESLRLNVLLILVSCGLYLMLEGSKFITLVSLTKYPVILYVIGLPTGESNWLGVIIASLFFVGREVLEEFFNVRNKKIEVGFVLLLVNAKLISRYV